MSLIWVLFRLTHQYYSKIAQADYEIVLSTPERFYDEFGEPKSVFKTLCLQKKIGLIAIDEAHLIRLWASFRLVS